MRTKFRFKSNSAITMVMAAGLALAGLGLGAAPAEAKRGGGGGKNSPEFVKAAMPLQTKVEEIEKLKSKAGSEAQISAEATAVMPMAEAAVAAATTGQDKLLAGQFLVTLGGLNGDMKARQRGAQLMIDSGNLSEDQFPQFQFYLGNFAYGAGDYPAAARALKAASDLGFQHDQLVPLMMQAYGQANMAREGLAEAQASIAKRKAAGLQIPEDWISRGQVVAYKANMGPEAIAFSTLLVQEHPSPFNWLAGTQMVRSFAGLDPQATLDLFRLMNRSGALDNEAKYVENEYKEYIETADPRKNPGEVAALLAKANAANRISAGSAWARDAQAVASARIAGDKASLPGLIRDAKASSDGKTALIAGDVALNYGDAAQAEEMYALATGKGVADMNIALTRLGIAQFDQGKFAEAEASFAKVTGPRQTLARLWQALIAQRKPV